MQTCNLLATNAMRHLNISSDQGEGKINVLTITFNVKINDASLARKIISETNKKHTPSLHVNYTKCS